MEKIAISFDCAWGVDYTDTLLSVMESENVKCTFFMVEFWTEKYPEYVKKIDEAGHEIGTHSATHSYMSRLTKEEINALEHSRTYTGNQVFLILDGNGMIVDVSFRCLKSDRSILTDEKLQKYIALLKGRKVNLEIFPKQGNSYPRSEWRAYHPLGLYTYSFE